MLRRLNSFVRGSAMPLHLPSIVVLLLVKAVSLELVLATSEKQQTEHKGLAADWKITKQIPKLPGSNEREGGKITVWVERSWLIVRRQTGEGDLEWYVALARATNPEASEIRMDVASGGLAIRYGGYFVREISGNLRVLRERKDDLSVSWPGTPADSKSDPLAAAGTTTLAVSSDWCWVTSGPSDEKPDVRVRLQHVKLATGHGAQAFRCGLTLLFCGDASFQDEGDLLVAKRTTIDSAKAQLRIQKIREEIGKGPAPPLDGKAWLNTRESLSLDKLKGNVVLLDFWGQW